MTELVLVGHFLTRAQAARRSGLSASEVALRPDLLRLHGTWLQETYFAFQFDEHGIRTDLARAVLALKARCEDEVIADWLGRPNRHLGGHAPVDRPRGESSTRLLLEAAERAGPTPAPPAPPGPAPTAPPRERPKPAHRRRHLAPAA